MTDGHRAYRLLLLAYPRAFRDAYGEEIVRTAQDMRRHDGMGRTAVALHVARDIARSAPRLRMEATVTRTRILAGLVLAAVTALAVVAGAPQFVLLLLVPLVLLGILVRGHDRPVAGSISTRYWWRWGCGGAVLLGALVLAEGVGPDFDWLPGAWYLLWFLVFLALALVGVSAALGGVHLLRGRRQLGEPPAI